ncbi:Long-chain-fatty-acid--CoA ligase [Pseudomonas fluorescens]|uniref:Long-chain-fatty-acid--CoA ligase n=1 Tax=Pseudomonas fluorescens TaxID=294 RepID=A0A5E7R9W1_PSEFL|nr:AMP-binding protein [Pseudomonas fluorescens]VVP70899.1 Long-chain-fatty-acid--CoA ligase [Pseudomonas fluorescens]
MSDIQSPVRIPLWAVLCGVAEQRPEADALVAEDGRLTYRQLVGRVDDVARSMLALGLKHGDHIGLLRGNSVTWAVYWYAAASLGLVTVPLNTRFRTEELSYGLDHEDIRALFCVDRFLDKIDFVGMLRDIEPAIDGTLPGQVLPLLQTLIVDGEAVPAGARRQGDFLAAGQAINPAELQAARARVQADDTLLIQLTSGTTSYPKGVMLSHAAMLGVAQSVARRIGVRPEDRYFSPRPFYHVSGSTMSLLVALVEGACLVTAQTFDPGQALEIMAQERCTLTSGNDTMFLMMLADPGFDPSRLHLRGGWAAASPHILRDVVELMGAVEICNAYGLSEAAPNLVVSAASEPLEQRIDGYMLPHEGISIEIRDPKTGATLAPGEVGEICAKGWSLMKGYYKLPDKTAETLRSGWLYTGDLGELGADGRLRFIGRLKDMFRVGGENVSPLEVEQVLLKHPSVELAQVVGVPDPRLGEVPAAYVTLRSGQQVDATALIAFCKERCANFKVPRYLSVVEGFESIGMTGSSKVQKNRLREHAIKAFGLG